MKRALIKIECDPIGRSRPRFARTQNGVRVYGSEKDKALEDIIAAEYLKEYPRLWFTDCEMVIQAWYPIPKSWSKKKQRSADNEEISPGKPDVDNVAKLVMDALNNVAYADDKCVIKLEIHKSYCFVPGLLIDITEQ